jgi:hypothetical protein
LVCAVVVQVLNVIVFMRSTNDAVVRDEGGEAFICVAEIVAEIVAY